MFRTRIQSSCEPVGISPVPFEVSDTPRQKSIWHPTLRRIRRGLFSNKSPQEPDIRQKEPNYIISNLPCNGERQGWLNNTEPETIRCEDGVTSRHIQPRALDANMPRDRTQSSKEPDQSRGFNFIKRSLSKSKQRAFGSDTTSLVAEEERRIGRESEPERIRPTTAIYMPGHLAPNFSKMTEQRTSQQQEKELTWSTAADFSKTRHPRQSPRQEREQRRPVTASPAYVLKHAASDSSKMKLSPKIDHDHPLQPNDNATVRPATYEPSDEFTDYQNFIASARIAAARTYNSHGVRSPNNATPKTSKVMDEIVANHNDNVRLQRSILVSRRSTVSRPLSTGGVFEKVGDYIKPPRPESALSGIGCPPNVEDDKSRRYTYPQEMFKYRWSIVSSSVRRSFLMDSYAEVDEEAGQGFWMANEENGQRENRAMPTSPGLKKYNRASPGAY